MGPHLPVLQSISPYLSTSGPLACKNYTTPSVKYKLYKIQQEIYRCAHLPQTFFRITSSSKSVHRNVQSVGAIQGAAIRSSITLESSTLFTVTLPSCERHQCECNSEAMGMKTVPGYQSRPPAQHCRIDQPRRRPSATLSLPTTVPGT
jgi:hypothetical protein